MTDSRKTILYFTCQPVYIPGEPATGGGLRTYGIGQALSGRGHRVIYSEPEGQAITSENNLTSSSEYPYYRVEEIPEVISRVNPDIVIMGNWGLVDNTPECAVPVVVDVNGSLVLENYYRKNTKLCDDMLGKVRALERVDLVLAGSEAQRIYLLSWCLMAGVNPDQFNVKVLPFSLSPSLPKHVPPEDPELVMAGYNWPWLDGQNIVEIVSRELDRMQRGYLNIFTSEPPYFDIFSHEDSVEDVRGVLDVAHLPRVRLYGQTAFGELTEKISQCTAALDVWQDNMERELAVSSRAVVYLWCGLPIITNKRAGIGEWVENYGAGWTVSPEDENGITELIRDIVDNPGILDRPRKMARQLVREKFTWDKTIATLDAFCRDTRISRNNSPFLNRLADLESNVNEMDKENSDLKSLLASLSEKVKMLDYEAHLLGDVNRRPRGLEVILSPRLLWRACKRYVYGIPVLVYLFILGSVGEVLSGLRATRGTR